MLTTPGLAVTSFKRFIKSPIWTCVFTTPNSNNSLYASCAFALPGPSFKSPDKSIPSANAFLNKFGWVKPSNNIPFAPANAPALKKLRKCVGIDKTVLATCDIPFGNNKRFL